MIYHSALICGWLYTYVKLYARFYNLRYSKELHFSTFLYPSEYVPATTISKGTFLLYI